MLNLVEAYYYIGVASIRVGIPNFPSILLSMLLGAQGPRKQPHVQQLFHLDSKLTSTLTFRSTFVTSI
jgi:hypothetical protein